jgi:antitoxin HigA-1
MTQNVPPNPFHPGEILLEDFLKPMGLTQVELALKLGWSKAKVNRLINGKGRIGAGTALDLAETLGTSAKLWMNFQDNWDLNKAVNKRLSKT